uniref:Chitin-binding type-2 domain-containing protein n=1 Tax=Spodoptera litura multicapsid nucleopolyhedrovirus TaxID=46242 RepID=A0A6B9UYA5_NPVST|nr:hypothetical protein [Spodoptera litura nucleopolyhedrovirus]UQV25546.1 hypothetical protein [Spodoptera litura nucleopolyhedrovirus]WML75084.1 hypothetical protein KBIHDJOI_00041 [Spodoptera littoralis nucleopolyhedrovirus]WOC30879.1 hypothetical protein GACBDANE_00114 [Spodoptera litura nucleopolyhedrovirus]
MWLLLAFFIILKLMVYHQLQKMQFGANDSKICPRGYHGTNSDPFDCNAYYLCPQALRFFCPPGQQFDLDSKKCENIVDLETGCVGRLHRNLLL